MKNTLLLVALFIALAQCIQIPLHKEIACGATCAGNNDCGTECSRCVKNECMKGLECSQKECLTNTDCEQSGSCKLCTNGTCTSDGMCGSYCTLSSQCVGSCEDCVNNECVAKCGHFCFGTSNCNFNGSTCPQCIDQRCQVGGCGAICLVEEDCMGQGNCTSCLNQRCSSTCTGPCTLDTDCSGGLTGCGACTKGMCSSGVCGSACPPGNNNACRGQGSSCSVCSMEGRCVVGAKCEADCEVDVQCDQSPESICKFCREKKCSRI